MHIIFNFFNKRLIQIFLFEKRINKKLNFYKGVKTLEITCRKRQTPYLINGRLIYLQILKQFIIN